MSEAAAVEPLSIPRAGLADPPADARLMASARSFFGESLPTSLSRSQAFALLCYRDYVTLVLKRPKIRQHGAHGLDLARAAAVFLSRRPGSSAAVQWVIARHKDSSPAKLGYRIQSAPHYVAVEAFVRERLAQPAANTSV